MSVLRQLHDDLDAAVFAAYGWPATLTDAEILERLVALNAERAKEEAAGLIRWLRPEYQNPGGLQAHQPSLAVDTAPAKPSGKQAPGRTASSPGPRPCPSGSKPSARPSPPPGPRSRPPTSRARFSRAKPADIAEILETLCTMGHAHRGKPKGTYLP